MRNLIIPDGYKSELSSRQTQIAIKKVKDIVQLNLAQALKLDRITAPIIVTQESGINDNLSGVERTVAFTMKEIEGTAEVVQSLAKWKRCALHKYGYPAGEGIYTDMNAIRRDDSVDNIHSIFVDQWDWESVITDDQRNTEFLYETVRKIVAAIANAKEEINKQFPVLKHTINKDVFFITSQELEDMYPDMSGRERENTIVKKYGTVFISQIGCKLKSGLKHDDRAPDYDDWALNGDILFYNPVLDNALELSSMGIRVNAESLMAQLKEDNKTDRLKYPYHQDVLKGVLPLTIGGGIGQSRVCMLLLEKAHIGEVQVSIWPDDMVQKCEQAGIKLL